MYLIRSENELLNAFRPVDQKNLELPRDLKFPMVLRNYFSWTEPSGYKTFLVFVEPGVNKPIGVTFDRSNAGGSTSALCDWCHSFGSANQIGLLTATVNSKRRVGVHLCLDLSCRERIEMDPSLSPLSTQERMRRVIERMSLFVRRTLL